MDGSSDRDPAKRDASRFEDAERAVHRVDASAAEPPSGGASAKSADESLFRTVGVATALGVGGIAVLSVVSLAVGLLGAAAGLAFGTVLIASLALGQYIGFIGLGTAYLRGCGLDWRGIRSHLGLRVPSLREVGVVVGGYLLLIATLAALAAVALRFLPEPASNQGAEVAMDNPELVPPLVVTMFLVVGPAEEFLFRGVVQNRLRERLSAVPAVAVAGVLFAAVHVISAVGDPVAVGTLVVLLVPAGLVLGAVYEYTGNLVVPWLVHSTHNSVLLTAILVGGPDEGAALLFALLGAA